MARRLATHRAEPHTFATLQLAAGTNPKIVSEVLGHKEVAITLDRYSHALPTMHTKAIARLDAIFGRAATRAIRAPIRAPPPPPRQTKRPIRVQIGPKRAGLVPHTGFPVNRLMRLSRVRPVPRRDA